jgi:hypothetical protein
MNLPVFTSNQANKTVFTGTMPVSDLIKELRNQNIGVNADAQRSLAKGADKESTAELLEGDRVEVTLRMKSFIKFLQRVMKQVYEGKNTEGFFGAIQLVIPQDFTGATLRKVNVPTEELPPVLHDVLKALPENRHLGVLELRPKLGQVALHIGDGQGRGFGFHSFDRMATKRILKLRKALKKKEKAGENVSKELKALEQAQIELEQIRKFLSDTDVSFVLYAAKVEANGRVVGLPKEAEMRLYIEGNALNSQASKEEVLKYEQFSPIVLALQEERLKHDWMKDDFIEEDSKSVSASSPKLFTLSALVQAFSFSVVGHNAPLKVDEKDFDKVGEREDFVSAFWQRVTHLFGTTWVPDADQAHGERVAYLQEMRGDNHRNVTFQAIFLMALGRLCYQMGLQAKWDPKHPVLDKLEKLSPNTVNYNAASPSGDWNERWRNAMMKQVVDTKTLEVKGYSFNNTRENVETTFRELAKLSDFVIDESASDEKDEGLQTVIAE